MKIPKKSREVFEYLKVCAKEMRTVNYKEVADAVGLAAVGLGNQLGYIRDRICRKRGLPWLNAIAVNKGSRRPGDSFLPASVSIDQADEERLWRGMVLQVFAYEWDSVVFKKKKKKAKKGST
ncbi:MAG TPA: hypothetical protein VK539_36425 [Myxococcaceae bacterium]|nr:hypothetical protein [Myxococcaceae bacterium]